MRIAYGTLIVTLLIPVSLACAQHKTPAVTLTVEDLTPKFLAFYAAASNVHADEPTRWALWQKMYGFAAVPPGPEGDKMARRMLDDAWPKYPAVLPLIRQGTASIKPWSQATLQQVADLLEADVPVRAKLLVFVGDFDGNAFTAPGKEGPTVALSVESPDSTIAMTHEFTHVVQGEQAHLSFGWERTIAHTVFAEGLAMRATEKLRPGRAAREYVGEFTPDWLARSEAKRAAILADIAPHLAASDSAAVMKYTMGQGGAGIDREAYYAGWLVIKDLLDHGWTFPRLARVPESDMVKVVGESLKRLQTKD